MSKSTDTEMEIRRGPWTLEEDNLLLHYITCHGEGRWNSLAKCAGLKRTGKSCRLRWLNYLKPDIKRGNISPQEQLLILELHSKLGNRWSKIAQHLPGRTDNEIKNYWRTRVQKQASQLNIDSNSKKFLEVIKCFWKPRLIEKMEQTSSTSMITAAAAAGVTTSTSTLETENSAPVLSPSDQTKKNPFLESSSVKRSKLNKKMVVTSPMTASSSICTSDAMENNTSYGHNSTMEDDCYYVHTSDYSSFNQKGIPDMSSREVPSLDEQMTESYWFSDEIAGVWNIDEFWQFKEPQ